MTRHLGETELNPADATGNNRRLTWYLVELARSIGDSVLVRLTE